MYIDNGMDRIKRIVGIDDSIAATFCFSEIEYTKSTVRGAKCFTSHNNEFRFL